MNRHEVFNVGGTYVKINVDIYYYKILGVTQQRRSSMGTRTPQRSL